MSEPSPYAGLSFGDPRVKRVARREKSKNDPMTIVQNKLRKARQELRAVLYWAKTEKAPLREQEIASIAKVLKETRYRRY